ncbi:hypothetical protein Pla52n_57800 [Stieleria varia]|uniref:Uncharacterized protein n=1 Tax=Stieleria varia TaxID=2528005 RepID=A0A5C6A275_9BACT|nr:hypothetical protein Pla52n_57800 [Stieleria varia]
MFQATRYTFRNTFGRNGLRGLARKQSAHIIRHALASGCRVLPGEPDAIAFQLMYQTATFYVQCKPILYAHLRN